MKITVIDIETACLEPPPPPASGICEIGGVNVHHEDSKRPHYIDEPWSFLVNPGMPIAPDCMGVHHITDADVAAAPTLDDLGDSSLYFAPNFVTTCAHNAKFEKSFLPFIKGPWIDTYKVAMKLWPDAPNHKNQTLRYYLDIEIPEERVAFANQSHRAAPDAYVTALILCRALRSASIAELIEWSEKPVLQKYVRFGKHSGAVWDGVPTDYLLWLVKQDMDEDMLFTAKTHLAARR